MDELSHEEHGPFSQPLEEGRRHGDLSLLSRFAVVIFKWNWLITLLLMFFIALGFGFKTPSQALSEVSASVKSLDDKVDKNKIATDSAIKSLKEDASSNAGYIKTLLEGVVVYECLNRKSNVDFENAKIARLPCTKLIQENNLQ